MSVKRSPISMNVVNVDPLDTIIKAAWITSRPATKESELNYLEVLSIDTPVSELGGIVVELDVPIIVREIICSPRDHIVWAQTSRVQDLEDWTVPDTISDKNFETCRALNKQMIYKKCYGAAQDKYRLDLPVSYLTKFTARISVRTWIKYVLFFQDLVEKVPDNTRAFWVDIYEMFNEGLKEILAHYFDFGDEEYTTLLSRIKKIDYLPRIQNETKDESIRTSNETAVRITGSIAFRAQVVRHRPLHVVDNLIDIVLSRDLMTTQISHELNMSISATNATWNEIVSKRNCWLAQSDIWYPIVARVSSILDIHTMMIPCSDGVCPYAEDARQREKKLDPGLPCPRFTTLNGITKDLRDNFDLSKLKNDQIEYAIESGRSPTYWSEQVKY